MGEIADWLIDQMLEIETAYYFDQYYKKKLKEKEKERREKLMEDALNEDR